MIEVREPVGVVYARLAAPCGLSVIPEVMQASFRAAWRALPVPQHSTPPPDDDRNWWRELVARSFAGALGSPLPGGVLEPLFESLYAHYAQPEAWMVYEDVEPALELLARRHRLFVLSNFDHRLRSILAGHGIDRYFEGMIISSEVGASKPHARIFQAALALAGVAPGEALHWGDDETADVQGALDAGIRAQRVCRPESGLLALAEKLPGS